MYWLFLVAASCCSATAALLPGAGGDAKLGDNSPHDHDGFFYALLEKRSN
jgi:hypothetical protein